MTERETTMGLFSSNGASDYRLGLKAERDKDYASALKYYSKAAKKEHAMASYKLAIFYSEGLGTEKDYDKAIEWADNAYEYDLNDEIPGLLMFSSTLQHKKEEEKRAQEAAAKKAAEQARNDTSRLESDRKQEAVIRKSILDFPDEEYPTNELLNKGIEFHQSGDDENALGIFLRVAELGDPGIQFCCSQMYSEGMGTEIDMDKALFWMEKSAEQGYPVAMYEYAMMHKDLKTHFKWMLKAYKQTDDAEVSEKAEAHLKSLGIPKSMIDD